MSNTELANWPVCPYCNHIESYPEKFLTKDKNDLDTHTCHECSKEYNVKLFIYYRYTTSKLEENAN